jgi:hypothetical protein
LLSVSSTCPDIQVRIRAWVPSMSVPLFRSPG